MATIQVSVATLRSHLASVLDEVSKKGKSMIITKKGREIAGIVDLDLLEDLEALRSKNYLRSIKKARGEFKKGQSKTFEEVFGEI